jgi:hypothetical protein
MMLFLSILKYYKSISYDGYKNISIMLKDDQIIELIDERHV